jgi:hypothetical protein
VGQIIVPIYRTGNPEQEDIRISCDSDGQGPRAALHAGFQTRVRQLQAEARRDLLLARQDAHAQLVEETAGVRRQHTGQLYALVGITRHCGRLNRHLLSRLTLGQLNVILNDFLGRRERKKRRIKHCYPIDGIPHQYPGESFVTSP